MLSKQNWNRYRHF